jgi:hypothetical protein
MAEEHKQPLTPVARLCSEIQLFDLCELDSCGHRDARFCTNEQLLARFEAIREEDDRQALLYDENEFTDDGSEFDEVEDEFEGEGDDL